MTPVGANSDAMENAEAREDSVNLLTSLRSAGKMLMTSIERDVSVSSSTSGSRLRLSVLGLSTSSDNGES